MAKSMILALSWCTDAFHMHASGQFRSIAVLWSKSRPWFISGNSCKFLVWMEAQVSMLLSITGGICRSRIASLRNTSVQIFAYKCDRLGNSLFELWTSMRKSITNFYLFLKGNQQQTEFQWGTPFIHASYRPGIPFTHIQSQIPP